MKVHLTIYFLLLFPSLAYPQRLELFTSHSGQIVTNGLSERVPYGETTGYFDFLPGDQDPDSMLIRQPTYFVYFKLPYEVTELGIRFISPVPPYAFAEAGDIVTELYELNKNSKLYFNPSIAVEQFIPASDTLPATWEELGRNEDSGEVMQQPNGKATNALLRLYSHPFPMALYRVRITSGDKTIPQGSFLMQIGTLPGLKRMTLSRNPAEL